LKELQIFGYNKNGVSLFKNDFLNGLNALTSLMKLTKITLSMPYFDDHVLARITSIVESNPALKDIDVVFGETIKFDKKVFQEFTSALGKSIECVSLKRLHPLCLLWLLESLGENKSIKCFDVIGSFKKENMDALGQSLAKNTQIEVLNFYGDAFNDIEVGRIFEFLPLNSSLSAMHFTSIVFINQIGFDAMVNCVANNRIRKLHSLTLNNCVFPIGGHRQIFNAFSTNSTIQSLRFVHNIDITVDDEEAYDDIPPFEMVSKLLQMNSKMHSLHFSHTKIFDENVMLFFPGLLINTTLTLLNLSGNQFEAVDEVYEKMQRSLKGNTTLRHIWFYADTYPSIDRKERAW
jgi:hypothetical protein